MILLDPDLGPRPASLKNGLPEAAARDASTTQRIPSTRALNVFLREAQAAVRLRGQVTVLLTTDAAIRKLNRQFRGKNKATDVLSFPAAEAMAGEVAGDLAISVPTALRQASEQGHPLGKEIKILMLHGLLHLAGYDHETDTGQMARRERLLRSRWKLPQGLIERAGEADAAEESTGRPRRGQVSSSTSRAARSARRVTSSSPSKTARKRSRT